MYQTPTVKMCIIISGQNLVIPDIVQLYVQQYYLCALTVHCSLPMKQLSACCCCCTYVMFLPVFLPVYFCCHIKCAATYSDFWVKSNNNKADELEKKMEWIRQIRKKISQRCPRRDSSKSCHKAKQNSKNFNFWARIKFL